MLLYRFFVLLPVLFFLLAFGFPVTAYPQATLIVEDAEAVTGGCTTVAVSLAHAVEASGIQLDICDEGDHLVALGCKPTARVPVGYSCRTNELEDGCASIILFPSGQAIPPGTGPVLTITYGVFWDAPVQDLPYTPGDDTYSDLVPSGVRVADADGDPLPSVDTLSGAFHFIPGCANDAECPDDGIFCNGIEVCLSGECVPTESCPAGSYCDEDLAICRAACSTGPECDDGLFCTGVETCEYLAGGDGFYCAPGVSPCGDPTPVCDEDNNLCVECLGDSDCDDGLFCTGTEVCVAGSCQAGLPPCPPLSICDENGGACLCSSDADCDDGLYCNGVEDCNSSSGTCNLNFNYLGEYPCLDCRPNLDDCDCDEVSDACLPATLTAGNGSGLPDSTGNAVPVSLDTLFVDVNVIQMDVCDVDDELTCTGCAITGRTPAAFSCLAAEQVDGCCTIVLADLSLSDAVIEPGTGPIYAISYDVKSGAPADECRPLNPQNIQVAALRGSLAVDATPGNFCFSAGGAQAASFTASANALTSPLTTTAAPTVDPADQTGSEANAPGKDLRRMLFGNTGSEDNPFPFEISETCPFDTSLDDPEELAALRGFRDNVLSQNVSGIIFTFLFYRNAPELTRLFNQHKELKEKVRSMVSEYSSLINDVSSGGTAYLLENDRVRIIELLEKIKGKGSPQLKTDIDLVIEEINAGTLGELCGIVFGD